MNNTVMVDSILYAAADCEAGMGARTSASTKAGKSGLAFAETPPMARMREAEKSDKSKLLGRDTDQEEVIACQECPEEEPVNAPTGPDEQVEVRDDLPEEETIGPAQDTSDGQDECLAVSTSEEALQVGSVSGGVVAEGTDGGPPWSVAVQSEASPSASPDTGSSDAGLVPTAAEVLDVPAEGPTVGSEANVVETNGPTSVMAVSETEAVVGDGAPGGQTADTSEAFVGEQTIKDGNSNVDAAIRNGTSVAVSDASGATEAVGAPSAQEAPSENVNKENVQPGQGQSAAAIVETDKGDAPAPESRETPSPAPETGTVEVQGTANGVWQQARAAFSTEPEKGAVSHPEPVGEAGNNVSSASEPSLPEPNIVSGPEIARERGPVHSIADQILDSVRASSTPADRQILVRLDPPELGSIMVRFQEKEGQIAGVLEVTKDQTRQEVEQALPQVVRGLQEAGVLVRRVEVVVADQSEKDMDRDPLPQDAWGQQEESRQEHAQAGDASVNLRSPWAARRSSQGFDRTEQYSMRVSQDRIDMLV